ncbi:hypothetical protein CBS101457_002524 [Exobasidium rhododendri]|nr:hypothetical protein CBS101457_002524 [Exobasidium rhododendri]
MVGHMEHDEVRQASTSTLRATPTKQTKRLQDRNSRSPYPKASPKTPVRRLADEGALVLSTHSPLRSPQSPGMRALSSIVSLLTPFGSRQAKKSAAFGLPEQEEEGKETDEGETMNDEVESDEEVEKSTVDVSTLDYDMEEQESIYPALSDEPISAPPRARTGSVSRGERTINSPRQKLSLPSRISAPGHSTEPTTDSYSSAAAVPKPSLPSSSTSFTFGRSSLAADSTRKTSYLPSYPRPSARQQLTSPLAKNYDLLARFFAEKAEHEVHGGEVESPSSANLVGGESVGEEGGLTEIEVAGCMRLIEESLAQGRNGELERLRGDALERARSGTNTPSYYGDSRYQQGYMSRSPSLPLGATAGEMSNGRGMLQTRPSSSFLSPAYQRSEDDNVNRTLATTFASASAPTKRRHRPLYLGPGQGAGAATNLLRRNQQAQRRNMQTSRPMVHPRSVMTPSWQQREEVDLEDRDASGSNMKRRRLQEEEVEARHETTAPTSQGVARITPSQSLPSFLHNASSFSSAPSTRTARDDRTTDVVPPRTATADAMLSILSSGPSIPIRRSAHRNKEGGVQATPEVSSAHSDIVNPYQTRSRLSKRASVGVGSSALIEKEKERLKEEREKRQKAIEDAKRSSKESTLEMIERTAPKPVNKRGLRRTQGDNDDHAVDSSMGKRRRDKEETEQAEAASAESKKRQVEKEQSENRRQGKAIEEQKRRLYEQEEQKKAQKDAEEERKRKTEEVKKRMEQLAANSTASKPSPVATDPVPVSPSPSTTSLSAPRKSFAFGASSFAPKKPSPLSQGNTVVPDSPSGSSEASEREYVIPPAPVSLPKFSLSNGAKAKEQKAAVNAEEKKVQAPPASTPFSPTPSSTPKEPREQAIDLPVASLPKFDFSVRIVQSTYSLGTPDDAASQTARQKETSSLPTFDLIGKKEQTSLPPSPSPFSFSSKPTAVSTPPASFSFAMPAAKPVETQAETANIPDTPSADAQSQSTSDKNVSALLSGTGEGEEDEDCLHEVRCKVWSLKDGQWVDLGIGLFKIKRNKGDGKKRVLVRNAGNGKVMVNFRLTKGFKAIKDKNFVSFLGFDGEGKPVNYRCKVKTNESADELSSVMEREAMA